MKKAILVGLDNKHNTYSIEYSLNELKSLALECEIESILTFTQKAEPNKLTYIGKGKLEELIIDVKINEADVVIFNDELSPLMLKNLNEALPCEVLDRSLIILEIFLKHARTNEAKLEIKLAHLKYLLPRLSSLRDGFDRQGGIGSKGPGETQLELDRRHLQNDILKIERELLDIHKMKKNQIERRKKNTLKTVALVGYTNAGKSTTLNKILDEIGRDSEKQVLSQDKLFATLSTSVRSIEYNGASFLLTDTIGFVSKLPTHLIHSFTQTLEEVKEADLIIHVLDVSSPYVIEQFQVTMNVLANLGALDKKMLVLLNKADKCEHLPQINNVDHLVYSNKNDKDVKALLNYISSFVLGDFIKLSLLIPYQEAKILNQLIETSKVISQIYLDNGIQVEALVDKKHYKKFALYEISDTPLN